MPRDLVTRIDLDQLYPPFVERLLELLARCRAEGADYYAISGYRSDAEQAALYAQGRTAPGPIATKARAGYSWHNYGLAADLCRDADVSRAGLQPTWDAKSYEAIGRHVEACGLEWAGGWRRFRELPHVQWPGLLGCLDGAARIREGNLLSEHGGLPVVWAWVDSFPRSTR